MFYKRIGYLLFYIWVIQAWIRGDYYLGKRERTIKTKNFQ